MWLRVYGGGLCAKESSVNLNDSSAGCRAVSFLQVSRCSAAYGANIYLGELFVVLLVMTSAVRVRSRMSAECTPVHTASASASTVLSGSMCVRCLGCVHRRRSAVAAVGFL